MSEQNQKTEENISVCTEELCVAVASEILDRYKIAFEELAK